MWVLSEVHEWRTARQQSKPQEEWRMQESGPAEAEDVLEAHIYTILSNSLYISPSGIKPASGALGTNGLSTGGGAQICSIANLFTPFKLY
jgi:hypothetical protein